MHTSNKPAATMSILMVVMAFTQLFLIGQLTTAYRRGYNDAMVVANDAVKEAFQTIGSYKQYGANVEGYIADDMYWFNHSTGKWQRGRTVIQAHQ